jgi:hypothetical protein
VLETVHHKRRRKTMRQKNEGTVAAFYKNNDPLFIRACEDAGIPPTKRQASKWLAKKGLAWKIYTNKEGGGAGVPGITVGTINHKLYNRKE